MLNIFQIIRHHLSISQYNWHKTLCSSCYFKTEDNVKLSKLLNEGFKRLVFWNQYKTILKDYDNEYIRERLHASFQGVNKLFVLAYACADNVTNENSYRKYFLSRLKIKNYNIEIDGRNFYDQSINELIKQ